MPSTRPASLPVALQSLRRPIESFNPVSSGDRSLKIGMLGLADQLADLWSQDEDETLESDILFTAVYAFSALTVAGPTPAELVELAAGSYMMDAETADILRTLKKVRTTLGAFDPPGFAAALMRSMLLAIFRLIELFVLVGDDRSTDRCFELLDVAEAMADRFSGAA